MISKDQNIAALVAYFEEGARQPTEKLLGVEVEHVVVMDAKNKAVSYEGSQGEFGIKDALEYLKTWYPDAVYDGQGQILGLANADATITLEPAAQIELSIAPFSSLKKIATIYQEFLERLTTFLVEHKAHIEPVGYHPSSRAKDLALIPKERYHYMNDYFASLGTRAERMMRGSTSTQVSIDYENEKDAIRKLRIATALVPVLSAIADNSPVFEGVKTSEPLVRLKVWRDVDNDRCGIIPHIFEKGFSFATYADWLLSTSPIFVPEVDGSGKETTRFVGAEKAYDVYADAVMQKADIEHLISMFWPDIRLKHYVEIRPADSLPLDLVMGYAALIKGIFYQPQALSALEAMLGVKNGIWPLRAQSVEHAISTIRLSGYQADVYGKSLKDWIELLFGLAYEGLEVDEVPYLASLRDFALHKALYGAI